MFRSRWVSFQCGRIDREFGANQCAELAVHAVILFSRGNIRVVISLVICIFCLVKNLLRAESNANIAAFTSFGDDKNLAAWGGQAIQV